MTMLSLFQPRAFDIGVSRSVQLGYERPDEICFVFETQLTNLGFNLSDSG